MYSLGGGQGAIVPDGLDGEKNRKRLIDSAKDSAHCLMLE